MLGMFLLMAVGVVLATIPTVWGMNTQDISDPFYV